MTKPGIGYALACCMALLAGAGRARRWSARCRAIAEMTRCIGVAAAYLQGMSVHAFQAHCRTRLRSRSWR